MSETNRAKNALLLLLLCLSVPASVFAERLSFKSYTTADGLANDNVNRIVADSRGFLWFCTSEGLSRFDGYRFKNYSHAQGLPHRSVHDFLETKDGDNLVATSNGLAVFDPYGKAFRWNFISERLEKTSDEKPMFRTFFTDPPAPNGSKAIFTLAQTSNGNLYAGSNNQLFRILKTGDDWRFEKLEFDGWSDRSINFNYLHGDSKGNLWIATSLAIYLMTPDGTISRINESGGNSIFEDRVGRVWVDSGGNDIGIRIYSFKNRASAPDLDQILTKNDGLIQNGFSNAVAQTGDGRIFVISQGRLLEFLPDAEPGDPKFRRFENEIDRAATDQSGNVWFEIPGKGAAKYTPDSFTVFDERDGLSKFPLSSIFGNREGEVYAVLGNGEIVGFVDGKPEKIVPFGAKDRLFGKAFLDFQSIDGEWWIPTGSGLRRYPRVKHFQDLARTPPKNVYTTADGLEGNAIFNLFEDSRGDIWISLAYEKTTLHRWERATGKIVSYPPEHGLPVSSGAVSFAKDTSGNLWFGFYFGQVVRFKDGKFRSLTDEGLLPQGAVSQMLTDNRGRLWLATASRGLFRVDRPNDEVPGFTNVSEADGLSGNQANCLTQDKFGRLYVGTGRGISRLDPETGRFKIYTTNDGLPGNAISNCYRDAAGTLWFSSNNSLIRFVPRVEVPAKTPPILIDGIGAAGVARNISELGETELKDLEFAPEERQIRISFFAISFDTGETLRYQYKLGDQEWSAPSESRSVDFNLAAGNYRFAVRAVNSDGVVSENPASVTFSIRPPYYQRGWFLLSATALVCFVLYSLYLYRTKNLRRVNQALTETQIAEEKALREREKRLAEIERVRARIATDLHDDIGSSLTQIAVLAEVARNQAAALAIENVSTPLESIKGVSRELVETMSDVVWAINPRKDNLRDVVQRMRRFAYDVCAGRGINFELDAPPTEDFAPLGANVRREIFAIFKESINNSVKYAECKNIAATFRIENERLFLEISDDGRGFDVAEILNGEFSPEKGGNGLGNMRRRAEELGGFCRIVSTVGGGTSVFLEVPHDSPEDESSPFTRSGGEEQNGNRLE